MSVDIAEKEVKLRNTRTKREVNMADVDLDRDAWVKSLSRVVEKGTRREPLWTSTPHAKAAEWALAFGAVYKKLMGMLDETGYNLDKNYGIPITTLHEYGHGRSNPAFHRFLILSAIFGVTPDRLRALTEAALPKAVTAPLPPTEVRRVLTRCVNSPRAFHFWSLFPIADALSLSCDELAAKIRAEFKALKKGK